MAKGSGMKAWTRQWEEMVPDFVRRCEAAREALIEACAHPREAQARVLAECIEPNRDTAFGREHGFSRIRTFEDYRRQVPVRGYDELAPWIERAVAGEEKVLTDERPNLWLRTSGTTGQSKKIPQTPRWRYLFRGPAISAQWGTYLRYHPYLTEHPHATLDLSWERDEPTQFFAGRVPYQSITHRSASLGGTDWMPPWHDAPWFTFGPDTAQYHQRMYLRLRHLVGRELRVMVAVNPSTPIALANHLATTGPELVKEVFDGTLFGRAAFTPDLELARSLEKMLARDGALRPRAVWPRLNLVVCWKSASAGLYMEELHGLYPHAELLPFSTTGTEGVVTLPVDRHPSAGVLAITQGVYEFIPSGQQSTGGVETLLPHELTVGREYRLVMTQGNGLYRYAVGDLYRVLEYVRGVPRLEFTGRDGNYSSFTGEKLVEGQVTGAVRAALRELGLQVARFTCCPTWGRPPFYTLVIEPSESLSTSLLEALAREFDAQLGKHNDEYSGKRTSGRLEAPRIEAVRPSTFQRYWDECVAAGAAGAQFKHKWLQKDDAILAHLRRISGTESLASDLVAPLQAVARGVLNVPNALPPAARPERRDEESPS